MSKTNGPLLSFDAGGSLGKTIVYSKWKGISYARRWVQPANPNTTAQQAVRGVFGWLMQVWSYMPAEVQESWNAYASGQPLTGRNALAKFNVADLQGETDLTNFVMAPSAKSGPIAAGISVTPGSTQLTVALTAPVLPSGWSIVQAVAAAIRDQDPATGTLYEMTGGTDATAPYSIVLTGLTATELYSVGGWFKYERPDGTFAYGRALMDTGTPTA
jgi:hypothetical protein